MSSVIYDLSYLLLKSAKVMMLINVKLW